MRPEIKPITQFNLDNSASVPQEFPDIVILAGHSGLQRLGAQGGNYAVVLFGDMLRESKGLDLSSFDLPAVRA